MIASLPVLTGDQFDLLSKVAVILFAVVVASTVFAWQVSRYRRVVDGGGRVAVAVYGPEMERIHE